MVNCAPAKCLCLPDLVPAQAFVRAGNGGGIRNAGDGRGWACGSGGRLPSVCVRPCNSGEALPSVHARHCGSGGRLPSVHARHRGSGGAFCLGSRPALRLWWAICPWFAPGDAFLLPRFAFVHACLFSLVRKKEAACDVLHSCSAGSRSPFVRSRSVGTVIFLCGFTLGLCVSLWRSRRVTGGRGGRGTGLAAWPLCVFAQSHWH